MSHSIIYVGNTHRIEVTGLKDADGAFQNDATVTLETLVDELTGTTISGVTLPLSLNYVTASNGDYNAPIPSDAGIVAPNSYIGTIKAIASGGEVGLWQETMIATIRED